MAPTVAPYGSWHSSITIAMSACCSSVALISSELVDCRMLIRGSLSEAAAPPLSERTSAPSEAGRMPGEQGAVSVEWAALERADAYARAGAFVTITGTRSATSASVS